MFSITSVNNVYLVDHIVVHRIDQAAAIYNTDGCIIAASSGWAEFSDNAQEALSKITGGMVWVSGCNGQERPYIQTKNGLVRWYSEGEYHGPEELIWPDGTKCVWWDAGR